MRTGGCNLSYVYRDNISSLYLSYIDETFFYTFVYEDERIADSFYVNFIVYNFQQIKNTVLSIIAHEAKNYNYDRTFLINSLYDFYKIVCKKCYGL